MKVRFLETNSENICCPLNLCLLPDTLEVLVINGLHIHKLYEIYNINLPVSLKYLFINDIEIEDIKEEDDMKTIKVFLDKLKVPFDCKVHILRHYIVGNVPVKSYREYYDGEKSILEHHCYDYNNLLEEVKNKYCFDDYFCVNPDFIRKLSYINEKYLCDN